MLISKLDIDPFMPDMKKTIYTIVLVIVIALWSVPIIGYAAVQLYVLSIQVIVTNIAIWISILVKTYILIRMVRNLPKREEVFLCQKHL